MRKIQKFKQLGCVVALFIYNQAAQIQACKCSDAVTSNTALKLTQIMKISCEFTSMHHTSSESLLFK